MDEAKQQQAWADDQQRLFFHEIELLNSSKDSATKDRILRRLLNRVEYYIHSTTFSLLFSLCNGIAWLVIQVSQPKLWKASTGAVVEVDTAEIEHLRDTRIMYEAICSSTLTEDRVRALHLLKRTVLLLLFQKRKKERTIDIIIYCWQRRFFIRFQLYINGGKTWKFDHFLFPFIFSFRYFSFTKKVGPLSRKSCS